MSLDLPTENLSLHFNSHAYVERDSIIRHNTIIHNLISTHTQTNWSKQATKGRPYEKIIIAAGDTLIPHSSLLIPHLSIRWHNNDISISSALLSGRIIIHDVPFFLLDEALQPQI